jgi:hypothetical protein
MGYIVKRPTDVKHENKQYNTYNIRVKKTHSRTDKYKHTLRQKKDKDNNNNNKNLKKKSFFFRLSKRHQLRRQRAPNKYIMNLYHVHQLWLYD